ncbi:MAG: CDP-glycerol glycerophosphotransferase family protein [Eggerthellaceae bacterium]|nr:CDP-glycerol glycerophosphotransferase family protein [Eggerthellaceae bacterium]
MSIAINILKAILAFIYLLLKRLPTNSHKVLFASRQANRPSEDFEDLQKELRSTVPDIKIITICCRFSRARDLPRFALASLRSMYHLATSKVCILDAYWPVVSILKHKKDLTVIQMWHALGKIKKSGFQTLDGSYGRSAGLAKHLNMHANYDYIIAGGRAWNKYYCESFGVSEDVLVNVGLPRIDHLIATQEEKRANFFSKYKELEGKKIILYAPTYRKGLDHKRYTEELIKLIDFDRYALIVRSHPNQKNRVENDAILTCKGFKTISLLAASDYLITDYSAIAIEAAVLNIKTYYYLYDYEEYSKNNGINIDLPVVMKSCVFHDAEKLMNSLTKKKYPQKALDRYRSDYLPPELGTSTQKIAALVAEKLSLEKKDAEEQVAKAKDAPKADSTPAKVAEPKPKTKVPAKAKDAQ